MSPLRLVLRVIYVAALLVAIALVLVLIVAPAAFVWQVRQNKKP